MSTKKKTCIVDGCTKEVIALDMCVNCYNRTRYWHKRSMKDKVKRVKQIQVWEASLELQLGNVRVPKASRRKAG